VTLNAEMIFLCLRVAGHARRLLARDGLVEAAVQEHVDDEHHAEQALGKQGEELVADLSCDQ
jgi:hypothetical protein